VGSGLPAQAARFPGATCISREIWFRTAVALPLFPALQNGWAFSIELQFDV